MAGCVDDAVGTFFRLEINLRSVDRDALFLFFFQGIEQEGKFETFALLVADVFDGLDFAFGQTAGVRQQSANERGFAVVYMTNDDKPQELAAWSTTIIVGHYIYPFARSFCMA